MINYLIWLLVLILYAPIFKVFYNPIWKGFKNGPSAFFNAFSKPWGHVPDYTHAYFILPVSIWLIWRKRTQLKQIYYNYKTKQDKNIFSFCVLLLGIIIFIFGSHQGYEFIYTLSLVPLLFGLIGYLYGTFMLKSLLFPLFYLLFLVPPPTAILDSITLPMRHGISIAVVEILRLFSYPIARDGLLISMGYTEIFMGQPCSGFRSLITMFSLVLVYVYISKWSITKKLILTSCIIPFALFGNLIRVIMLCLITFYFGEAAGQGFFHNFSGIMIFIITILGVIGIESLIERFQVASLNSQG